MSRLIQISQDDDSKQIVTLIDLAALSLGHAGLGLVICDLVRHVSRACNVEEDDVWEWVDKERHHHTTDIQRAS